MQYPKSSVFEMTLIEAVKHLPILYDRNTAGYNSKPDIDRAWETVLNEVCKKVKNVNVTHCKLRWRSLRDRYVKQFIKTENDEIIEPDLTRWEYYNQLEFLRPHLKKRKYGPEKSTIPTKRVRPQPIIQIEREFLQPQETTRSFVEIQKVENFNTNSCSDSSIYNEPEVINEIDTEIEQFQPEPEVALIEFVPLKRRRQISTENQSDRNPPKIVNEFVIDPISDVNANFNPVNEQKSTEDCINNLMHTVNNLLRTQQKKEADTSPNESYFKVLDGFLQKFQPHELDEVKVEILNLIVNKKKSLDRMKLM